MPPKRKALAEVDANKDANPPPAKKTSKAASAKKSVEPKETAKTGSKNKKTTEPKETSKLGSKTKKSAEPKETAKTASTTKKATASKEKAKAASATKEPVEPKETTTTASEIKKSAQPKAPKARKFKYSNAETVSGPPKLDFVNVAWPGCDSDDGESGDEEEQEEEGDPKVGDFLTEDMIKRVSKMGYPVTNEGIEKFQWMINEQDKRDQDRHNMYIYNDFSGYGSTEMIENMLADFNKILFKKDVSPFKKWAYVEALATFLKLADLMCWMMNDDSGGMCEIMDMFGTMLLTSLDMLSEHGLLAADSPLPNIGIVSLLMIEFIHDTAGDYDICWAHEVVRALDKAGVEIKPRKEVRVSQEKIDELREQYEDKESEEIENRKNIYKVHSSIRSWEPDDDFEDGERIWARWDWKKEYAEFKHSHPGGDQYNLEKWSKKEKAEYTFGTKEFEKKMEDMMA